MANLIFLLVLLEQRLLALELLGRSSFLFLELPAPLPPLHVGCVLTIGIAQRGASIALQVGPKVPEFESPVHGCFECIIRLR